MSRQSSIFTLAALAISASYLSANAASLGDPAYQGCSGDRSIFGLATVNLSPNGQYNVGGHAFKIRDISRHDLDQQEEKIFFCNDTYNNTAKLDRAEIHRRMNAVWTHIHEAQITLIKADLDGYKNRVLVPEEVNRLTALKQQNPELVEAVDSIIESQKALVAQNEEKERQAKEQIESDKRAAREKAEAAQRAEAEQAEARSKAEAADQAAAARDASISQANKISQAAKAAAFAASVPQVCRIASDLQAELQSPSATEGLDKAVRLAAAGDNANACTFFTKLAQKLETTRADFVSCSKELESNTDPHAALLGQSALSMAAQIHGSQANVQSAISNMNCQGR